MFKKTSAQSPAQWKLLLTAVGIAGLLSIAGACMTALLLDREVLQMEQVGYAAMVILLIGGFTSARIGMKGRGEGQYIWGLAAALGFFLMLLAAGGLFYGGHFEGIGVSLAVIAAGAGGALLMHGVRRSGSPMRRYKTRVR